MTQAVQPPVLGGPCPYLSVSNAAQAAEFYAKAVGAVAIEGSEPGVYRGLL